MARKPRPVAVTMAGVEGFAPIAAPNLPEPRCARAIDEPGVRHGMLTRMAGAIRMAGAGIGVLALGLVPVIVWPHITGMLGFGCVLTMITGGAVVLTGASQAFGTVYIWGILRDDPWRVYTCTSLIIKEDIRIVRITVTDGDGKAFLMRTGASRRRREALRGMVSPEVWLAGDPEGDAVLTPAGGGPIFYAHPNRLPPRPPTRGLGQSLPLPQPAKLLTPQQQARADAKAKAEAVARAAREKSYAAQRAQAVANYKAKHEPPPNG